MTINSLLKIIAVISFQMIVLSLEALLRFIVFMFTLARQFKQTLNYIHEV